MSTESMSLTCADVIEHIGNRTDISLRRKQDLTSAVRRVCRLLHRSPQDVSVDVDKLRRKLAEMSLAASRLSPGSYRNLKSLFGKALIAAKVTTVPRRSRTPLAPEWRELLAAITDAPQRYRLAHFARYLSERGIDPAEVDNEILDGYRRDLISNSLLRLPAQAARHAVRAWNRARGTEAGRHLRELEIPYIRGKYALSPALFPKSFREDLDSYQAHLKGDDLFGERGARPASGDIIILRRYQILVLAAALVEAGRDPQSIIRSLADLAAPETAKIALTAVWKRLGQRKTGHLHNLACLIVYLGRHWAKLPADELDRLRELRRSLNPGLLPIEQWPEAERAVWQQAIECADPFSRNSAPSVWAEGTRVSTAAGYARWLSWISEKGVEMNGPPADRVTPPRVQAYIDDLRRINGDFTILRRVQALYSAIRIIAPDRDWRWLLRVQSALQSRSVPVRDKKTRIRPTAEAREARQSPDARCGRRGDQAAPEARDIIPGRFDDRLRGPPSFAPLQSCDDDTGVTLFAKPPVIVCISMVAR